MKKVLAGQRMSIPAATFNTMIDAAAAYQRTSLSNGSEVIRPNTVGGIVIVKNSTGANLTQFAVVGINSVLVTPMQNAGEFANRFAFDVVTPGSTHTGKFAVLQEPIKAGGLGRAMVVGVSPVDIKRLTGETSQYAGVEAGQTYLKSGIGGAQILWEDTYTGEDVHLAIVRMPHSNAADGDTCTVCACGTTANITLSGLQTIDGITTVANDYVLVKNQSTASQNGVYKAASSAWTKVGQPRLVAVLNGTTNSTTLWMLTAANTYSTKSSVASMPVRSALVATTANITLSGTQTVDGVVLIAGNTVLVKNQSTASQNGLYTVASSAWVKDGTNPQPEAVLVRSGTTNGRLSFVLSAANTYSATYAVYK